MDKLEELGIADDTILLYTSDNGCSPMADFEELAAKGHNPSYVFRGTKADIYEGGHRIPLLLQWPSRIKPGGICDRIVCLSDLMGTMADILGAELPVDMGEDSVSNLPLWLYPDSPEVREDVVHQSIDGSLSIRKGRWKLEMCPGSGGWSYPKPGEDDTSEMPRFQLYDLETDIGERDNLIENHPEVINSLRSILREYIRRGRSTPGPVQKNEGEAIWETVAWLAEE
jgi:arylsulfatase A-like enzyme